MHPNFRQVNWTMVLRRIAVTLFLAGLAIYTLWPWLPGKEKPSRTLVLYGFSIMNEVMVNGIFPAFQREWERQTGENVEFVSSYAGSGTITNQIIMGVPAEVAILSLELDAIRLVKTNVVPERTWLHLPNKGVINRTPFIILVEEGNPRKITDFEDLTLPGTKIVHPDPLTSGGAQWALLAEYGAALRKTGSQKTAVNQLRGIWKNVVAQSSSARAARTQFNNGFGNVLITYEQEALYDRKLGRLKGEIVYPQSTVLSEHTVIMISRNIDPEQREFIESFVSFLWSYRAQKIFVAYGFRSIYEELNDEGSFEHIEDPFTVDDLGGWEKAKNTIVDSIWKEKIMKE